MNQKIKTNFALTPKTVANLKRICESTYRSPSAVIEILVSREIDSMFGAGDSMLPCEQNSTISIETEIKTN